MMRPFLIGTAAAVALVIGWLAWDGWVYLQRGYSLGVSLGRHPASIFHVAFPAWRAAIHFLLWVAAMAAIVAYVASSGWASAIAWLTLTLTLLVGVYDARQYGTVGSPTSIWTVLALLVLALLTRLGPLAPEVRA